jgi:hypothetical protein
MKPFADLNHEQSINLSFTTYIRLSGIMKRASSLFLRPEKPAKSLENFFAGFKKGSKTIRKIMCQSKNKLPEVITAFCTVTNQINIPEKVFGENLGLFEINSIPNNLREFIFKFFHNRLGLNARIAHFLDNSRWCTFCSIVGRNLGPFEDETFCHFFLTCPTTVKIHSDIMSSFFPGLNSDISVWLGIKGENKFLRLFILAIQFQIWSARLKGILPESNYCAGEAIYSLADAVICNTGIRNSLLTLPFPLSRLWDRLARARW